MTPAQKLVVANLLRAIEAEQATREIAFTISLPPTPGQFEEAQRIMDGMRDKARAYLAKTTAAARDLLED